jgi:C_GCAxxG_C_C family probable redox protein
MNTRQLVKERVHNYYWNHDFNCAETTLRICAEIFGIGLDEQVIAAAKGMHGAGEYGAQCGLVEGALMFLGLIGAMRQIEEPEVIRACRDYAQRFEARFGSLLCRILRPEGFHPENPPHLCEQLSCDAIEFFVDSVSGWVGQSHDVADFPDEDRTRG